MVAPNQNLLGIVVIEELSRKTGWSQSSEGKIDYNVRAPNYCQALIHGMLRKVHAQLENFPGPIKGQLSITISEGKVTPAGRVQVYGEPAVALFGSYLAEAMITANGIAQLFATVNLKSKILYMLA